MIAGEQVVLRRVEPADYPDIVRWQNDEEIFRMMDYERPFTLEDIERGERKAAESGHPFIIELDGRAIGRIGLNRVRGRDRIASLYIFIGEREVWGRGVGLDAVRTIVRYGFEVLNLRLIELLMIGDNERAARLYKKAGFVEEARLPDRSWKGDRYVDHVIMSVRREGFPS